MSCAHRRVHSIRSGRRPWSAPAPGDGPDVAPPRALPPLQPRLIMTRFDTTFRLPDRTERLCFGIPGGLCEDCHQLYIDPELIELLDLARRPLRVRDRERRRGPGAGLVLRRLTDRHPSRRGVARAAPFNLGRPRPACPRSSAPAARHALLDPEREGEPPLPSVEPDVGRALHHRVEVQRPSSASSSSVDRPAPGPARPASEPGTDGRRSPSRCPRPGTPRVRSVGDVEQLAEPAVELDDDDRLRRRLEQPVEQRGRAAALAHRRRRRGTPRSSSGTASATSARTSSLAHRAPSGR